MAEMHVFIGPNEACIVLPNGNHAEWLPDDGLMFLPHVPPNTQFRALDHGFEFFSFAWTFTDHELDVNAAQYWWDHHGPDSNQPDFFKNNTIGKASETTFSVVARLLKQAGADEVLHVSSPSLMSWDRNDLIGYVKKVIGAAYTRSVHNHGLVQVADQTTAKK